MNLETLEAEATFYAETLAPLLGNVALYTFLGTLAFEGVDVVLDCASVSVTERTLQLDASGLYVPVTETKQKTALAGVHVEGVTLRTSC